MTLILGILCEDGVVVGSDSAATIAAGGIRTVHMPTRKIEVIDDRLLIAGAGDVGRHQRFVHIVKDYHDHCDVEGKSSIDFAVWIGRLARKHFDGSSPGDYEALLAFNRSGQVRLCEFGEGFEPVFRSEDTWYSAIGSGQLLADPLVFCL